MTVDSTKIQKNDVIAYIIYARVEEVFGFTRSPFDDREEMNAINLDTKERFSVRGNTLMALGHSADRYESVEEVTKTQAAEILSTAHNTVFTVVFMKQPKKGQTKGEMRTLRGRLLSTEPLLGRSKVEDLDITEGNRMRLVDHRTIESLIVNNVMYLVK